MVRMLDEQGKALEFCFFLFCANDPIRCHSLVPRRLRAEEFPGGLVGAKLFRLFAGELGVLALFVRVDGGLFRAASSEGFEAGGMHQAFLCKHSNKSDIDRAPGAGGPARSEANHVAGFIDAFSNAVDPAEAQGNLYGFGPGNTWLAGILFVKAHEKFAKLVVMRFEPCAEIGWRREECWFWRHGFGIH